MLLPEEFKKRWNANKNGPLIKFNDKSLRNTDFSNELKQFLCKAGLPTFPPPYLELEKTVKPITAIFNMPKELQRYWFLGSTGSGNPICITEGQEDVVFLDGSDNYKEVLINRSIPQFAECLLIYSEMIGKAIDVNGEDAFVDNDIPDLVMEWLKKELERIDDKCMEEGCFWFDEIEALFE
ncbi:SUKH-4 family immunity protein [Priestia endophytica]|uniref:SUKH-4 family immunity protein n=1 Tax=Priestia endophytica TaxID=135735 RepID=UPI00228211C4|nr:SUKH-4 family immunity protein [Priestia endophytica]MCY8232258.1 SUKH-4 family immunity protein [Priestia endophytica]